MSRSELLKKVIENRKNLKNIYVERKIGDAGVVQALNEQTANLLGRNVDEEIRNRRLIDEFSEAKKDGDETKMKKILSELPPTLRAEVVRADIPNRIMKSFIEGEFQRMDQRFDNVDAAIANIVIPAGASPDLSNKIQDVKDVMQKSFLDMSKEIQTLQKTLGDQGLKTDDVSAVVKTVETAVNNLIATLPQTITDAVDKSPTLQGVFVGLEGALVHLDEIEKNIKSMNVSPDFQKLIVDPLIDKINKLEENIQKQIKMKQGDDDEKKAQVNPVLMNQIKTIRDNIQQSLDNNNVLIFDNNLIDNVGVKDIHKEGIGFWNQPSYNLGDLDNNSKKFIDTLEEKIKTLEGIKNPTPEINKLVKELKSLKARSIESRKIYMIHARNVVAGEMERNKEVEDKTKKNPIQLGLKPMSNISTDLEWYGYYVNEYPGIFDGIKTKRKKNGEIYAVISPYQPSSRGSGIKRGRIYTRAKKEANEGIISQKLTSIVTNPEEASERLELIISSIEAGNTSPEIVDEAMNIIKMLTNLGILNKTEGNKIKKVIKSIN